MDELERIRKESAQEHSSNYEAESNEKKINSNSRKPSVKTYYIEKEESLTLEEDR
jgi:hypothetical protein